MQACIIALVFWYGGMPMERFWVRFVTLSLPNALFPQLFSESIFEGVEL